MEKSPIDIDFFVLDQIERPGKKQELKASEMIGNNIESTSDKIIRNNMLDEEDLLHLNRALLSLQSASSAITSCLDLEQVINTYTWEMANLVQAQRCSVFEWDAKSESLTTLGAYPSDVFLDDHSLNDQIQNRLSELTCYRILQRVIKERTAQRLNIDLIESDQQAGEILQALDAQQLLVLPMVFQDRVVGLVTIIDRQNTGDFSDHEISIAQLLTDQAVGSIVNAQLYRKLSDANQRLAKANDDLDAYSHTVAHNLKDPLSNLLGFAHFMHDEYEEISQQDVIKFLNFIIESGMKIKDIIDGLLLLANIRKEDMHLEPIDMAKIISGVRRSLASSIEESQPEITVPSTWPQAWGYSNWIEQIWLNYISNALKYGGLPPRIELGADVQPRGLVRFWVKDNGKGLSVEEQKRLFKPFAKLSPSSIEGHGLGLSIVERMTCKMGGYVGVESTIGRGSLFYFTLPAGNPDEDE